MFGGWCSQGLSDKVAIRQYRRQPLGISLQDERHFRKNQLQGHMVTDQMMEAQRQQPFILGRIMGDIGSKQRGVIQINTVLAWIRVSQYLRRNIFYCGRSEFTDSQRRLTPDHLYRLFQSLPINCRAQNIMAVDDLLQGVQEAIETITGIESE
ncbi:hypothetical protein Xedl_02325 [Xenorhabdus eapokensis]|uniref:Uncharacterized protein n=1 Tax=Xenorhabdus eapokensis TaxID=1873482 RepID=A0A1Q5TQF2_9GAMM|nr:hypothetical protein Xedl_02325 [Xenorhabdus eapokensis]